MTLFRPQRSSLKESMEELREVRSLGELQRHLGRTWVEVRVEPYDDRVDTRTGWLTHIVMAAHASEPGKRWAVGFTDGPLETFTEEAINDALAALYQDGQVDLRLADHIAALLGRLP